MKLDKKTLSILIIVFVALALIVSVPETFNGNSEQKEHLNAARAYFEKDLCALAIDEYKQVIANEDTIEVELEMAKVYARAYENGEIKQYYALESFYDNLVSNFREEPKAYDAALKFYFEAEDYSSVVEILTQAKNLKVKSKYISEITEKVRYKYFQNYSMITDMEHSLQDYYTVRDGENYYVYNEVFSNTFPFTFQYASVFVNNYVIAKQNDQVFIMNKDAKRVAYLDKNVDFSTGLGGELLACRSKKVFSYYNLSGKKVFGDYIFAGRFREGYAAVQTKKGWTIIDTEGNPVINKYFEDIKYGPSYESVTAGCFFAKEDGKYYLYNVKGEKVSGVAFDDCDIFINKDSYAAVCINGRWGFIDINGKQVIDCKFDVAKSFSNGLAFVMAKEKGRFINSKGKIVITDDFLEGDYFNNKGYCLVKGDAYWQPIQRYYTLD